MLKIRLYKDCILNETYQNVFSLGIRSGQTKNVLERYLEGLQHLDFEINNAYYENSGEFVVEFSLLLNPYNYNYMKVIDDELNLVRYCFINKIQLKNGCAYIDYLEDVWSSYQDKIKGITESFICNSRMKKYSNFEPIIKELPFELDGNDELEINSISFANKSFPKYWIIAQIQLYDLVQGESSQNIQSMFYAAFAWSSQPYDNLYSMTEMVARYLMEYMTNHKIRNHNYNIGDVYVLPDKLFSSSLLSTEESVMTEGGLSTSLKFKVVLSGNNYSLLNGTINNDYKNLFIGTYDNNIKFINNGTDVKFNVFLNMAYSSGFNIKLSMANQIIDITNSFKYDIPFTSLNASEYQQRKIAVALEKENLELDLDEGKFWSDWIGHMISFVENTAKSKIGRGYNEFVSGMFTEPFFDRQKLANQLDATTAAKYSNNKGIAGNANNMSNFNEGIFIAKIKPDNEYFVKQSIDNLGLKIYEYIDNYNLLDINNVDYWRNNNITYNTIKFKSINVYGEFTREVALILNNIFETSVKIWFTPSMEKDNYEI